MGTVVRVLPDQPAIDRPFDYVVPPDWDDPVVVGTPVRIELGGRRLGGWVVEVGATPEVSGPLRPLRVHGGLGPDESVVDLARWTAHRWAGRWVSVLRTAQPPNRVRSLPPTRVETPTPSSPPRPVLESISAGGCSVVRTPPGLDPRELVLGALGAGPSLVILPGLAAGQDLAAGLRAAGASVAVWPRDWASAAAGVGVVVGTRTAVFARMPRPASVLVLDTDDEALQAEQNPTWHARDVAVERARRWGVPVILASAAPDLATTARGPLRTFPRDLERASWPAVEVIDRRKDRPGPGSMFSERLARTLEGEGRAVCVLNRKGRSRMLICDSCDTPVSCERCGAGVAQPDEDLSCPRCGFERPPICSACGSMRLKRLQPGVTRVASELAALISEPVGELTGDRDEPPRTRVIVGTEAALHRLDRAEVVVFLDFDAELLAPRYRAAEQAMKLLVRAARLVGGRSQGGRVALQTRQPEHAVVRAAVLGDPGRASEAEDGLRSALGFPPYSALAEVSGPGAAEVLVGLADRPGLTVLGATGTEGLVLAPTQEGLASELASAPRPSARVRVAVDPPRV